MILSIATMSSKEGRPRKGEALVRTYAKLDPSKTEMKQFPMVQELRGAWEAENVVPYQEGDDAFWQMAVRWALLKKFSHCPKELENPYQTTDGGHRILQFSNEDMKTIKNIWEEQCTLAASTSAISSDAGDKDLCEFMMTSGLSNGRSLQWSIMHCGPAKQFQLHAHPNIEIMYCLRGALHEIRMNGNPVTKDFETDTDSKHENGVKGPDLTTTGQSWKFVTIQEGEFLVNEVGSIHKSFAATNGNGCSLLLFWGGSHADITKEKEPKSFSVQGALEKMDQKLCDCGDEKTNIVPEIFLPESERSQ